jgi:hypothetical protein
MFTRIKNRHWLIVCVLIIIVTSPVMFSSCQSADFKVSNLTISPGEALAGDTVTISADVTNIGNAEGSYNAVLLVNGEEELSKYVTLGPDGAAENVEFLLKKESPGTYDIEIGELEGTLQVISIDEIIENTTRAMAELESFHFNVDLEFEIMMPGGFDLEDLEGSFELNPGDS